MQTDTPGDSRLWEREPATIPIRLVLKDGHLKADDSAFTVDISFSGAAIRTALALRPGEWVGFVAKGEFPHAIPTRVVWVREDESSHWTFAGLAFIQNLDV